MDKLLSRSSSIALKNEPMNNVYVKIYKISSNEFTFIIDRDHANCSQLFLIRTDKNEFV